MPSVVFDASSLVGALLKAGSVPERALLLARSTATICLSDAVEAEIREVFARPKFAHYLASGRGEHILDLIVAGARRVEPSVRITECRDAKDNKYLELALAAEAHAVISSDADLLVLHPWRGIPMLSPADYLLAAP
jgi:putative PIN family toxin of toxin-antitoxin system